jgi:Uma2 family endonuclease
MGSESSSIAVELLGLLREVCRLSRLGTLFGADCGYQCFQDDRNRVRKPDASFVRADRLPGGRPPKGYIQIAPDLAVEVISPNDLAWKLDRKIDQYLDAGVRLVWVINPETRKARVYRADGTISSLSESDELSEEDVIPGFHCRLSELFLPPNAPAEPATTTNGG